MNPFGVIRRGISFYVAGVVDKSTSIFTDKKCDFGKCVAARLHDCEPWEDHFETRALNDLRTALQNGDYDSARGLAAIGAKDDADPYCVNLIERLIDFVAKGHEPETYIQEFYSNEL